MHVKDGGGIFNLAEADTRIHDARLEFDTISLEGGTFSIAGYAVGVERGRAARYALRVRVGAVASWRIEDEAQIGTIDVHEVRETDEGIAFESHFPSVLTLTTDTRDVEIDQAHEPFSVRRWFRWRSV